MKPDRWGNLIVEPHERQKYNDLSVAQLILWHNGDCRHHAMTGECCPDFSCCYPDMYEGDTEKRMDTLREAIQRAQQED